MTNLNFKGNLGNESSDIQAQHAGIRQGCPLSSYLFVLVMHVLFHDVHALHGPHDKYGRHHILEQFGYQEILYADDTLLLGGRKGQMEKILHAVECESKIYNLRLNTQKCECMCFATPEQRKDIHFANGEKMPNTTHVKYLGGIIRSDSDVEKEIRQRISMGWDIMCKLARVWKSDNLPIDWKFTIYTAMVQSKVTYGLETIRWLPRLNKIIAHHESRCFRKILKVPSTYVDRKWTDEKVRQTLKDKLVDKKEISIARQAE